MPGEYDYDQYGRLRWYEDEREPETPDDDEESEAA